MDADIPTDATDRSTGVLNNFSHGCGTLSILAGATVPGLKPFGCAPNAEVVPVRVANRVVLFSNSSIARGLDYVHQLCKSEATRVHVVSMSMGGLPSEAWADAINALYEAGVIVVTAAGNNYANRPTRFVVYPARFGRVIAACGVMADGSPYANLPPKRMAGNYGPKSKLRTAIAAYTPNVPWAWSPMSSLIGRFQPAITLPAHPSERVRQRKVRCRKPGSARRAAIAVTSLKAEPGGYWP